MSKYAIIEERVESKTTNVIDEALRNGLQSGKYTVIDIVDDIYEARKLLNSYRIHPLKSDDGYAALIVYAEEREFNKLSKTYEPTGSYEFADVVLEDEDLSDDEYGYCEFGMTEQGYDYNDYGTEDDEWDG